MKAINRVTSSRSLVFAIGLIAGWLAILPALHASVITLTGGDAGEGFTPGPVVYDAYHFYGHSLVSDPGPFTIQTATFQSFDVQSPPSGYSFVFPGQGSYDGVASTPSLGASANDLALTNMMRNWTWYSADHYGTPGTPLSVTQSGLVPGKTYQVDLLMLNVSPAHPYDAQFTFNGGQTNHFTEVGNVYYDVRENVVANGSGQIVMSLSSPDGIFNSTKEPAWGAFMISDVPEPSVLLLLGCGGWLVVRLRQRCSGQAR